MSRFIVNIEGDETDKLAILEYDCEAIRNVWCAVCWIRGKVPMQDETFFYVAVNEEGLVEAINKEKARKIRDGEMDEDEASNYPPGSITCSLCSGKIIR